MGLPDWDTVFYWINPDRQPTVEQRDTEVEMCLKNNEIRILDNYDIEPEDDFWENFPFRNLPTKPGTSVCVEELEQFITSNEKLMSSSQYKRALRVVNDLRNGANPCQKRELPPISVRNAKSALENGALLTDKIASWIKCGFVSGPFEYFPLEGFRANSLMAIPKNGKVRPIVNLSSPKGGSYNDNINNLLIEKVRMSTARSFSYMLKENGPNARIWKFDICDAYKLIPAMIEHLRLQGFTWLGRHFVETQKIFGGVDSVCSFDRLGETLKCVAVILSKVNQNSVARALDDFVHVIPENSEKAGAFAREFKNLCKILNIGLAENCPKFEKAFEDTTRGVVLGVGFDSETMTWFLTKEKSCKIMVRCEKAIEESHMSLKDMEKLMGSVNDLCQMCPFGKLFRYEGYRLLRSFNNNENILVLTTSLFKQDMKTVMKIAESAVHGIPIASRWSMPPLSALHFYSDVAGASYTYYKGIKVYHHKTGIGAACVGGESLDTITCWHRIIWPEDFMRKNTDRWNVHFGSKSTTLEALAVLLPFLAVPKQLAGRELVFHVDNSAVEVGWRKGVVKNEETATIVLRSIQFIASFLGARTRIFHVKRMSHEMATLADKLSRSGRLDMDELSNLKGKEVKIGSYFLEKWLSEPWEDWSLPYNLVEEVKNKIHNCS